MLKLFFINGCGKVGVVYVFIALGMASLTVKTSLFPSRIYTGSELFSVGMGEWDGPATILGIFIS